jgi:hypothetical protein
LICDRTTRVDLGKHPRYALLCRHRAAIDEPITIITLTITLTITLITLTIAICEERVHCDHDAHDNT